MVAPEVPTGGGLGEELGWRGYLFPALARRHGFTAAAGGTAAVWSLWHVPMFLLGDGPGFPFAALVVFIVPASFALGWIYRRTGGSVPVCAVFHGAANGGAAALAGHVLPARLPEAMWLYSLLFAAACALAFLLIAARGDAGMGRA